MTNTKARSREIQAAALRIVSEFGIERLDAVQNPMRKAQLTVLYKQLMLETSCTREAARQHIAKAARRLRSPDAPTEDAWGGARNGAGRRRRNGVARTEEKDRTMQYKQTYTVTCKPVTGTEPGAFVGIRDIETEFIEHDADGNEVYIVRTERNIDRDLDLSPGVISYDFAL